MNLFESEDDVKAFKIDELLLQILFEIIIDLLLKDCVVVFTIQTIAKLKLLRKA